MCGFAPQPILEFQPSSFLLSSRDRLYASGYSDLIDDVLNAHVYILIPFLCMLLRFLISLGVCAVQWAIIVCLWSIYCTVNLFMVLQSLPHF